MDRCHLRGSEGQCNGMKPVGTSYYDA